MVMYEAGMLARSKAGHDKAQMYIIKEVDDTYVYLVDGRIRTLGHPKKKKKKHVQIVHGIYNMKELDDAGIRKLIKDWMKDRMDSSNVTLSPGRILIKFILSFPLM